MKAPQDHKPKSQPKYEQPKSAQEAEAADLAQRTATVRGIEFTLLPSVSNDFELLLDLGRLQNASRAGAEIVSVMQLVSLFLRMLPDDEIARAMALVRSDAGTVPLEAGTELLMEFIQAINPNS